MNGRMEMGLGDGVGQFTRMQIVDAARPVFSALRLHREQDVLDGALEDLVGIADIEGLAHLELAS